MESGTLPGWYEDGTGVVRWWDGRRWTGRTREMEEAPAEEAPTKDRWGPGAYIGAGVLGVLFFGLPGITRSSGIPLVDLALTLGGVLAMVWLLIGIVGYAVRAGRQR